MIKHFKNKIILINMAIFISIVIFLFAFICIFTYNSQYSQLLAQLELSAVGFEQEKDTSQKGANIPDIFSLCVLLDNDGTVLYTNDTSISPSYIKIIVHEALLSDAENGHADSDRLVFLKKDVKDGSVIAYASTEFMDATVKSTVLVSLSLSLASIVVFFIITVRIARHTVKPIKSAWDSQKSFIDQVSQELAAPVSSIIDNNDALLSRQKDTIKSHRQLINLTKKDALKITEILSEIGDLTKSVNSYSLYISRVDLSEVTSDEINRLSLFANEKRVVLCPSIKTDVFINTNEPAYLRIASALFNTAITYSRELDKLRISLDEDKKRAYLYVNTPTYIGNDVLVHLIERAYQKDNFSIGLSIAKNLARALGGELRVKSNLTTGTTFMLTIKKK